MLSAVSWIGYDRIKHAQQRRSQYLHTTGHFTPQHRPYAPVGDAIAVDLTSGGSKEDMPQIMQQKPKTDREKMMSSTRVPVNDLEGCEVKLGSYDEALLQVFAWKSFLCVDKNMC